jgi:hypothetical protein
MPLEALGVTIEVVFVVFVALLTKQVLDSLPLELVTDGIWVNAKACVLQIKDKKRNTLKVLFRLIVFMGLKF